MPAERGGAAAEDRAPFDDTAAALRFALNADQVTVPSSYMNRMLAEFDPTPKRKKPTPAEKAVLHAIGVASLEQLRDLIKGKRLKGTSLVKHPPRPTKGLDGSHLAGFILREFGKLDDAHQMILTGLLTNPVLPCTCGRPCCSGWEPVARWVQAVDRTCDVLKTRALMDANPGVDLEQPRSPIRLRAGLSTQPALRRAIVRDWYTRGERRSLVDLAGRNGLTEKTVALHRTWIEEWLTEREAKAWEAANWWFDQVGITGPWL